MFEFCIKIFAKYFGKIRLYNGFTLSEVLLTLAIIGVVAAMTIPQLVQNYQNQELKVAFKKMYSNLTAAYNSTITENGGYPYQCFYGYGGNNVYVIANTECSSLFTELKIKLNIKKEYTGPVDGINIPDYMETDSSNFNGTVLNGSCNGAKIGSKSSKTAWTLSDGSMLISYSGSNFYAVFIIDTNGMKKPNKWGYDLFMLNFYGATRNAYKMIIVDGTCGVYEKGGYRINDILLQN